MSYKPKKPKITFRAYSDHPAIGALADAFLHEMLSARERMPSEKDRAALHRQMVVILSGLQLLGAYRGQEVGVPLHRPHYFGSTRRSPLYQPELWHCLNFLVESGYLDKTANHHFDEKRQRGWPATYRLSQKWIDKARPYPVPELPAIVRNPDAPLVELRDDDKRVMKPHKHPELQQWRQQLARFNRRLTQHRFSLDGEAQASALFSLYRVFSQGSYDLGGRFYGSFQQWHAKRRQALLIDGEPVVEVDFKFLHPALLYQWEGVELTADPYNVEDQEFSRDQVKQAFNVMLNRSTPENCWQGIQHHLRLPKKESAMVLEAAIRHRHPAIEGYFGTGIGLELQRYDSTIAEGVIGYMLDQTDYVVLPIHDSYVVPYSASEALRAALDHAEGYAARKHGKQPRSRPLWKVDHLGNDARVGAEVRRVFGDAQAQPQPELQGAIEGLDDEEQGDEDDYVL